MSAPAILALTLTASLLIGVPIAFSIGIATLVTLYFGGIPIAFLAQQSFTALDSFPLMAVPYFILAGALMETGGLSSRIINVAQEAMGNITGGFGIVTILACALFAAISGSSPATVAAIGSIMIPAMVERGYHKDFAAAVAGSGGGLGIVIPPSIPMIIYGIVAGVSIGDMFLAGFFPGFILSVLMIVWIYITAKKRGYTGTGEPFQLGRFFKSLWDAKWALLAPVIILGGIYSGYFTPTESAVIAVVYGLIIGLFVYRELKWSQIPQALISSALVTGSVMVILGTATAFGKLVTMYQIPTLLANAMLNISENRFILLTLIVILILFVGTFMETLSIIIIFAPLFLPILIRLGVDPIHFGILLVVGAEIGMMTPPLGVNLFVASGISGLPMERVAKAIFPFVIVLTGGLLLMTYVPWISTVVPDTVKVIKAYFAAKGGA
ncbi:C4-dicarboxylate ABC transporter permease [Ammoniphilus oxalaticus]|uniref:C4-dicarboxylate ABC transporter permease n=1 Tax=Ammoniphilus oxalaticus TaxID=66863 RepID=A0A419SGT4_9BACL|nr:TRAP transporter large permease [Ammoniphilus oxalaticus]RKD22945.1 C4-dicarboxylate ABC transporter permease [Ammoniphilus oxalaticus]